VRLLSVFFGTATIPIIYMIGKRMAGAVVGLAAAVFLAFSPFNIYFAQETRMYTLLVFNAAVAIYALVRLLTDSRSAAPIGRQFREYLRTWRAGPVEPDSQADSLYKLVPTHGWRAWIYRHRWLSIRAIETDLAWVTFVVFSAATMLTHNTAVFFPLATNIYVLGLMLFQRRNKSGFQTAFQAPSFRNWIVAQVGIFILWIPWVFFFIRQASAVYQRFWIPEPTWDAIVHMLRSFLNASAPMPADQTVVVWGLYGVIFCLGVVYYRKKLSAFLFLAALFTIPLVGELVVSLRRPIFYDRTLIWITIPLFLVLAAGIAQLRFRILMILAIGIFSTINLFSTGDYYRFFQKEDWSTAAGYVAYFAEKDDLILFNSNFVEIPFDYYFKAYEDRYSIQVKKQGVPFDLLDNGVLEPLMTESDVASLVSLISGHDRVWLVYSHDSYTDPSGLVPQTLASKMELIKQRNFYGGQVQLYQTP